MTSPAWFSRSSKGPSSLLASYGARLQIVTAGNARRLSGREWMRLLNAYISCSEIAERSMHSTIDVTHRMAISQTTLGNRDQHRGRDKNQGWYNIQQQYHSGHIETQLILFIQMQNAFHKAIN